MLIDPGRLSRAEVTGLVNGLVVPRPIAWVSTLDRAGKRNLAPFSFFNAFSTAPPTVAIGPGSRAGINKDSLRNVKATREFVVNAVTEELAIRANLTSGEFSRDVDEWDVAGLDPAPSDDVRPPRVAESPASLECRVIEIVELGPPEAPTNSIVVGRITRFHVDQTLLQDGFEIDPEAAGLVGRMGGPLWCTTRDRFSLPRPRSRDPKDAIADAAERRAPAPVSTGSRP